MGLRGEEGQGCGREAALNAPVPELHPLPRVLGARHCEASLEALWVPLFPGRAAGERAFGSHPPPLPGPCQCQQLSQ